MSSEDGNDGTDQVGDFALAGYGPGTGGRSGFVAVIGAPNAGKSTLVNRFVGAKVSIVTHKVQTTRTRVLGIAVRGDAQIVLVDTPGIFKPKKRLDRAMVSAAWNGAEDADTILLLIDAQYGATEEVQAILDGLEKTNRKALLALNKIDAVKRETLLALADRLNATGLFTDIFMISAIKGHGCDDVLAKLADAMPQGPWLFPEDQISDMPQMLLAAEIVREKLFVNVHEELPYSLTVETENWEERKDGSARVECIVYVERKSQKAIVLGAGGKRIKAIGTAAREELQELLDRKVHLFLYVKVRDRWQDDPERFRFWNLDFNA